MSATAITMTVSPPPETANVSTTTTTTTTTTTAAAAAAAAAMTSSSLSCCPKCGFSSDMPPFEDTRVALEEAQRQIGDLQAQVRLLNQKAAAAVDRWADYEDELAKLRSVLDQQQKQQEQKQQQETSSPPPLPVATTPASPVRTSFTGAASRISALLSPRKSTPNLQQVQSNNSASLPSGSGSNPLPTPTTPSVDELMEALSREQALRQEAETHVTRSAQEIEELSARLFEEANEMVAKERRARAALEERVEMLENRELDKRHRLEKLEGAMQRINKVRGLLGMQRDDQVQQAANQQPDPQGQGQNQDKGQEWELVQDAEQKPKQEEHEKDGDHGGDGDDGEKKSEVASPTSPASPSTPDNATDRAHRSTSLRKWLGSRPFSGERQA